MHEDEHDLVPQPDREAVTPRHEQKPSDRELVEQVHREVADGRLRLPPRPVGSARGIPYTQLPAAKPGEALAEEWDTYRREVGRLLADGQDGRYVLIKGQDIIGIFETFDAAHWAGAQRYLGEPFFVHPIRAEEPYLRIRGINHPWPNLRSL
jgi:hypothetical protein